MEDEFSADVVVNGNRDKGKTDNFEVSIVNSDPPILIHSKTTKGQGKCETTQEQQQVIDLIHEFIDRS